MEGFALPVFPVVLQAEGIHRTYNIPIVCLTHSVRTRLKSAVVSDIFVWGPADDVP
jgi:hypothetical protein